MLKISALRAYKAETHNLEVPGSSPGWSTKKKELEIDPTPSFLICKLGHCLGTDTSLSILYDQQPTRQKNVQDRDKLHKYNV